MSIAILLVCTLSIDFQHVFNFKKLNLVLLCPRTRVDHSVGSPHMDTTIQEEMAQPIGLLHIHTLVNFEWHDIVQLPTNYQPY